MANNFKAKCSTPDCFTLRDTSHPYCDDCKRKHYRNDKAVTPNDPFYSSSTWLRVRLAHLSRQPLCVICKQPGRVVDHVIPRRLGGANFDKKNLQTLCDYHHNKKRQEESRN